MSQYKLFQEVVKLSVAKEWSEAKQEWVLDHIYEAMEAQTCLCSHYPIIEICVMRNTKNNEHGLVGNCCVNKFFGIGSNKMFAALKRIRKNSFKSVNAQILALAHERKYIDDWEKGFYASILKKRRLSTKQAEKKIAINKKLLQRFDSEKT